MDLLTTYDPDTLGGDLVLIDGDLAVDDTLQTAIAISLLSDRRANPDDILPDGSGWRRGWWYDPLLPTAGDKYGSRLWLLSREKMVPEVLRRAEEYAAEALQWLIDDGHATKLEITATAEANNTLLLVVAVYLAAGQALRLNYGLPGVANAV